MNFIHKCHNFRHFNKHGSHKQRFSYKIKCSWISPTFYASNKCIQPKGLKLYFGMIAQNQSTVAIGANKHCALFLHTHVHTRTHSTSLDALYICIYTHILCLNQWQNWGRQRVWITRRFKNKSLDRLWSLWSYLQPTFNKVRTLCKM